MDPLVNVKRLQAMQPRSSTASTQNGATIDARDAKDVVFSVEYGGFGAGTTCDVKIQDSDDAATWADVAGGTLPQKTDTDANSFGGTLKYRRHSGSGKRYVRIVFVIAGGGSVTYSATAELHNLTQAPAV